MRRKEETFGDFISWYLMQMLTIFVILFAVVALIIVKMGNQAIVDLERELGVNKIGIVYEERLSVKEQLARYVDSLPIPADDILVPEDIIQETTVNTVELVQVAESDVMLLAQLMHAEEGILRVTESPENAKRAHMLAGSVALHRLEQKYLGAETLTEVIYSPGQYASVEKLNQKVPEETIRWAQELIDNGPLGPSNMIFQAEFEQGTDTYDHIGNQFFCCK